MNNKTENSNVSSVSQGKGVCGGGGDILQPAVLSLGFYQIYVIRKVEMTPM